MSGAGDAPFGKPTGITGRKGLPVLAMVPVTPGGFPVLLPERLVAVIVTGCRLACPAGSGLPPTGCQPGVVDSSFARFIGYQVIEGALG